MEGLSDLLCNFMYDYRIDVRLSFPALFKRYLCNAKRGSLGKHYKISLNFSAGSIFLTIVLYTACFIIALFRNKRKFSRMEIIDLLTMDRQNEPVSEKRSSVWKWCFVCSVGNIFLLYFLIFSGAITKAAAGFEIVGGSVK